MPLRQATDREDRPRPGAQHQPAPSFGRLARQIAVWTTRGLACALVMVLAVGFGVQTLRWWNAQPAEIITNRAAIDEPLADPTQWHVLQFASQPWQIHRRTLYGDKTAAVEALRERCRAALEQRPTAGVPATEVELQLLEQVAGSKPVEEQPGRWKLYCNDQTLPMLVGVSDSSAKPGPAESSLADNRPRVLIWALAAQQAKRLVVVCLPAGTAAASGPGRRCRAGAGGAAAGRWPNPGDERGPRRHGGRFPDLGQPGQLSKVLRCLVCPAPLDGSHRLEGVWAESPLCAVPPPRSGPFCRRTLERHVLERWPAANKRSAPAVARRPLKWPAVGAGARSSGTGWCSTLMPGAQVRVDAGL